MARKRHQDKDIEKVLVEAEAHGWVVIPTKKYWKLRCPFERQHARWVHLTPSRNYTRSLASWLKAQCMLVKDGVEMKWQMALVVDLQGSPEDVEALLDDAMERLVDARVEDPAVGAELAGTEVCLEFVVEADDLTSAHETAIGVIEHGLQLPPDSELIGSTTRKAVPAFA